MLRLQDTIESTDKPEIQTVSGSAEAALTFRERLPALDGLRGVAILAVFFFHYAGEGVITGSLPLRLVGGFLGLGWAGVDLFFVLSGFLITGILYDTRNAPGYYRNFYFRRALRILPVYYLVLAICFVYGLSVGTHFQTAHLSYLIFLGNPAFLIWPSLAHIPPLININHLWSLSVEEQFYLVWPWAVAKMQSRKMILWVCLGVGGTALALRILFTLSGWLPVLWSYVFLPFRLDGFAVGAAVAILMRGTQRDRLFQWAPLVSIVAAVVVAAICVVRHAVAYTDVVIATIGYSAIAVGFGALMVASLKPDSWIQRWMSIRVLRFFGKYSYGLYLYHFLLLLVLRPIRFSLQARLHSFVLASVLYLVLCLSLNLSIAMISFHFLESPIMGLKKRFRYRVPAVSVVASMGETHH